MINLSHQQLLDVTPSWYWMVSDQVAEFDDVLRRPIKNMEAVRRATEEYFHRHGRVDLSGSDTQISDNTRHMLQRLDDAGEDVARLYEWGRALDYHMTHFTVFGDRPSAGLWEQTIGGWRPDRLASLDRPGPDIRDRLYASCKHHVFDPAQALWQRCEASGKAWLGQEGRRSDWDDVLWDRWFGEFGYDPASVASDGYGNMLLREWWRAVGPTVSAEDKARMLQWHDAAARARDEDGFLEPGQIGPIDRAMTTDIFPPFREAAARQ